MGSVPGSRRGPHGRQADPSPYRAPPSAPRSPRARRREPRARCGRAPGAPPPAARPRHPAAPGPEAADAVGGRGAALTRTGPGSSSRWPRTLGREVACQAAGALPLWLGAGRLPGLGPPRVFGRRRSCAASCSGAPAASSPLRAQGQSPRSLQTPKRESESPRCRRAAAEAGTGARSLAPGGCSSCCSGLNLPSRSRRRRPVRLSSRASAAPRRPSPAHLPPGPRRAARGRARGGGGGLGAGRGPRRSPRAPSSLGKVYFRSASLCLWFHFLFLITIQIQ